MYAGSALGFRAMVAVASGLRFRSLFVGLSATKLVILSSGASMGVLAGLAHEAQAMAGVFVIPPLVVIVFVLHQHTRAVRDRRHLDRLLDTAVTASKVTGSTGVQDALVAAACTLLHTAGPHSARTASRGRAPQSYPARRERPLARGPAATHPRLGQGCGQSILDGIAAIGSGALGSVELLDQVRHQAFHDNLTGLPNRILFEDRVNQALRGSDRHPVGVLLVNLDLFKRVNDSLGHKFADGLLRQVAERPPRVTPHSPR